MRTKKKEKMKINNMESLAIKFADRMMSEEEIRKNDVTELFYMEIDTMAKNREPINIQIIGKVFTSKSTTASKLTSHVLGRMGKKMGLKYICADQIEFSRKVTESEEKDTCYQIDEWNTLSETGLNATQETAFMEYYSDIHAQENVNRISCSPERVIDKNANIVLEVVGVDKKAKVTRVLVSYRIMKNYMPMFQMIGHADIYVGDILDTEWYKEYRKRKFEKMKLVREEGIKDRRDFDWAELILEVFENLKKVAYLGLLNKEIVIDYVEKSRRESRRFTSILQSADLTAKIIGLLTFEKEKGSIDRRRFMLEEKMERAKNNAIRQRVKARLDEEKKIREELERVEKEIEENYKRIIEIKKRYDSIGGECAKADERKKDIRKAVQGV